MQNMPYLKFNIAKIYSSLLGKLNHIVFWVLIFILLTIIFGSIYGNFSEAFYFVSMLLPVVVATSYFFSYYLLPRYLLSKKTFKFILYSVYMLVISLYLEMIVITLSFIYLADYQYEKLLPLGINVPVLTITLYCIVFLYSCMLLIQRSMLHQRKIQAMELAQEKQKEDYLFVRADRKINKILRADIEYLESLGDYVKINTSTSAPILTKEKISTLSASLPDTFLRIHRSYVVNVHKIESYTKEQVQIKTVQLPISRTYKKNVWQVLQG